MMDVTNGIISEECRRSLDERNRGEHSRFLETVERGDAETVESLLKTGTIDVNRSLSRGYIHFNALHLAALQDDYKMIQVLQHYGAKPLAKIPIPTNIDEDILQSRSRVDLCRAHASPAYILFYSDDPIRTVFNLCCELKEVSDRKGIRNTCRETFEHLIDKCRNLPCKMLDYCFTSNEVDILLRGKISTSEDDTCSCRHQEGKIIYRTVKMALHAEQKEFISHNYCQTLLQRKWLQDQPSWSKNASKWSPVYYLYAFFVLGVFQLPLGLAYMFTPVCHLWRFFSSPKSKFLMHAISQSFFLTLILLYDMMVSDIPNAKERTEMTLLPMLVIIWGLGLFIQEMADAYRAGFLAHFAFFVNVLDLLTTFILVTVFTARCFWSDSISTLTSVFLSSFSAFAVVIAGLRFMQNFFLTEFIGPMLMHFANMFRDVLRFLLIFAFVCSAFVFGMHYLYNDASDETAFAKIESAIAALMGTVFGNTLGTSALAIDLNINTTSIDEVKSSSAFFSRMGFLLYSAFCLLCVIVLVNLFIAIMSDTYARLQEAVDIEWKFKRATMWMHYFGAPTLAPPLNLVSFIPWFIECCISTCRKCHCCTSNAVERAKCHGHTNGKLNLLAYDDLMKILVNRFLEDVDRTLIKYTDVIEPENGVTKNRSCEYDNVVLHIEESGF